LKISGSMSLLTCFRQRLDKMATFSESGRDSQLMKHAALGFRAHSGWTSLVGMSLEKDEPRVMVRQRPRLVDTFTYEFRQPYHSAQKMPLDRAREFLAGVESRAEQLAEGAIRAVKTELREQGYELTCFGLLLASTKPLPSLEKILLSHALIHAADGELFRRALIRASGRCRVTAFTVKEHELFGVACKTLSIEYDKLVGRLAALGKIIGSPWSQDEKLATIAAWLALFSQRTDASLASGRGAKVGD